MTQDANIETDEPQLMVDARLDEGEVEVDMPPATGVPKRQVSSPDELENALVVDAKLDKKVKEVQMLKESDTIEEETQGEAKRHQSKKLFDEALDIVPEGNTSRKVQDIEFIRQQSAARGASSSGINRADPETAIEPKGKPGRPRNTLSTTTSNINCLKMNRLRMYL